MHGCEVSLVLQMSRDVPWQHDARTHTLEGGVCVPMLCVCVCWAVRVEEPV